MKHNIYHRSLLSCFFPAFVLCSMVVPLKHATAQSTPQPALSGPTVTETIKPPSIIERDFQGSIKRLEIPPDEAAAGKLTLNETQQAALHNILTERAALVDVAVGDNYELLLKLQGFRQMTQPEQREHLEAWREALAPLRERGRLQDELSKFLEPAQNTDLRRMVNEYWDALVKEETTKSASQDSMNPDEAPMDEPSAAQPAKQDSDSPRQRGRGRGRAERGQRGGIIMRESLAIMGHQLKGSFDRRVASNNANLEDIYQTIDATPQQREKIKAISLEYAQKTLNKPTPAQRIEIFEAISRELTPTQRRELMKLYTQTKPTPKPNPGSKPMQPK